MAEPTEPGRTARIAFGITALIAAIGFAVNLVIVSLATYPPTATEPSQLGYDNPEGAAGLLPRVIDFLSYFTILSNIVVIVVLGLLWAGRLRPTALGSTLRMDSLIMITVTGLVFAIVLAPEAELVGVQYLTNTIEHYITPILTVVTFLVWGPRRWFSVRTVFAALVIPLLWLAYTFVRGAVIGAYPYGFLDAATLGYPRALANVAGVLVLGIVLGFAFLGLDRLLSRRSSARAEG